MRVFVYKHSRKNVWSVKALEGQYEGLVIGHATELMLRDATFKVSEKARQKVVETRRKSVHAGVVGTLASACWDAWDAVSFGLDVWPFPCKPNKPGARVRYNPYEGPWFTDMNGYKVDDKAPWAQVYFDQYVSVYPWTRVYP